MSVLQATVDHLCHRIFPYAICIFLLFTGFGLTAWQPYVILCAMVFIQKYNFKVGYFSGILENNVNHIENKNESTLED